MKAKFSHFKFLGIWMLQAAFVSVRIAGAGPVEQTLSHFRNFVHSVQPLAEKNEGINRFTNAVGRVVNGFPSLRKKPISLREQHFKNAELLVIIQQDLDLLIKQMSFCKFSLDQGFSFV